MDDRLLEAVRSAEAQVSIPRLRDLVSSIVDIPSPTGGERPLAEWLTHHLHESGLDATCQRLDDDQANAVGRLSGRGGGADLLLYAPIDTLTTGEARWDVPWAGPALRPDMEPRAVDRGDWVVGLGASNPKGHAACAVAAVEAIARAGVDLQGDLVVGLGAGGMPTNALGGPAAPRQGTGHGVGCSFMLEQGAYPDFAVIAKPGWSVAWEEVGLCWFRVTVEGRFGYVGSRHRIDYQNPIVSAATVVAELEAWFGDYAAANTSGLVAPQGNIGMIRSGWERTASFSPAACELMIDLRISPRTPPAEVKHQFSVALAEISERHPELDLDFEMVVSIPGTTTEPGSWIVRSCTRAWESLEGGAHEPIVETSGATDANIIRGRGIPTARVGMPKVADASGAEVDFALGMNAVDVSQMEMLTRLLVRTAIDTCMRSRDEVGLPNARHETQPRAHI